jgi:elongation factor G
VDSKEIAFVSAGRKAMLDALPKARATILEPIVNIEIIVPDAAMGDITGDLSSRRGQVSGTDNLAAGLMIVKGVVPLSELDGYAGRLKAMTQGQGSYSMELSHYEAVPPAVQSQLAAEYKAKRTAPEEED